MDSLFPFLLGGFTGLGLAAWHFNRIKRHTVNEDLEMRLAALEETIAYVSVRFDEVAVAQEKAPRSRGRRSAIEVDKDWQRVLSLAAEGLDAQSIAREVGKPQGQVELITKLYAKG